MCAPHCNTLPRGVVSSEITFSGVSRLWLLGVAFIAIGNMAMIGAVSWPQRTVSIQVASRSIETIAIIVLAICTEHEARWCTS
jgi:hypothetical protein